jgi:hypothetical protein
MIHNPLEYALSSEMKLVGVSERLESESFYFMSLWRAEWFVSASCVAYV